MLHLRESGEPTQGDWLHGYRRLKRKVKHARWIYALCLIVTHRTVKRRSGVKSLQHLNPSFLLSFIVHSFLHRVYSASFLFCLFHSLCDRQTRLDRLCEYLHRDTHATLPITIPPRTFDHISVPERWLTTRFSLCHSLPHSLCDNKRLKLDVRQSLLCSS